MNNNTFDDNDLLFNGIQGDDRQCAIVYIAPFLVVSYIRETPRFLHLSISHTNVRHSDW